MQISFALLHPPSRNRRRPSRQVTERAWFNRDDIWTPGFARLDGLVGDRFVGVAGQRPIKVSVRTKAKLDVEPRPAVMNLSSNVELQPQISLLATGAPRRV